MEIPLNERIPSHLTVAHDVEVLRTQGFTLEEIAKQLKVAKKTVSKAAKAIKNQKVHRDPDT